MNIQGVGGGGARSQRRNLESSSFQRRGIMWRWRLKGLVATLSGHLFPWSRIPSD